MKLDIAREIAFFDPRMVFDAEGKMRPAPYLVRYLGRGIQEIVVRQDETIVKFNSKSEALETLLVRSPA